MTEKQRTVDSTAPGDSELLSCLVDGELEAAARDAWISRLAQDHAACREWTLLHLTGDALRSSEVACWHSSAFAARVSAAIASEPTVMAPRLATRRRAGLQRIVLPGVALVAAAAVLAVVAVPALRGQAGAPAELQVRSAPASATVATSVGGQLLERSPQMEAYLAAHREVSGSGMMPPSAPLLRASTALGDEGR
jgi:negative regulator of sigma E activity